ncbi:CRISPR-associated endonuclease Cas2 [Candidatus Giovannonibacteria bacterium RIFCSPLOWO2_12_FULL_44_25]|uniref:Transcriptional repressor PaaX-like central Cas2-like domain-containing protein n=3 Tax=Parcubacteria group TaxID=1794811 RepID=A0A837IH04_9BACT|nr:MAG: hypothetical protein UW15_C0009G0026 [Parcubacteria group bacterium GW2011_GWC1_44_10]KKT59993.1 MAG: hypothetical protein UW53_C0004G0005 [Candidatus Giovannonibacteria bacterium GW2011_GWA1_44_25]KKU12618.1 MAG: hypothetical protein UX18_C0017G0004 [Candidatus Azambacteria bacterium GW2011_GWC2_45_7b]KKU30111.1 MAG: hypothetical protein UX43_C0002G0005 [Candidatus Giovannonibacteria bacterium GW2011_GWB1_46_20]OGF49694.1 MAG: CRISPR-associated endonuclease Cas2 [Candidatus Giovannonib
MRKKYLEKRLGPTAQKVLLLLLGGVVLGFARSPKQYWRTIETIKKDWQKINQHTLRRTIRNLYRSRLVDIKENKDDTTTIVLTEQGRKRATTYNIDTIRVPEMKKWDKKWRIILFDIPERHKKARDALAKALKNMGFYRLQKSVFVHPFECGSEVDFVIEFFNLRPYVRTILAHQIDNELHLKQYFSLT